MKLPGQVKKIRAKYVAALPVPRGEPGEAFEERARQWSIGFAEQVRFETDDPTWGTKRADGGRPISKDSISRNMSPMLTWDLLIGTGTGSPTLADDPDSIDTGGQVFVAVSPVNHLKTPDTPGTPDTPDTPGDQEPSLASFMLDMRASNGRIEKMLGALQPTDPVELPLTEAVTFPNYEGRFFGQAVTLKPVK